MNDEVHPRGPTNVRSPLLVALLCLGLVLLAGAADYVTGTQVDVSLFYFLPAYLAIWYSRGAYVTATLAACGASVALIDFASRPSLLHPAIPYWNAAVHLSSFLLVTAVLSRLKREARERAARIEKLSESIDRQERMEENLRRSNTDLEQFAHVAAHDLKAPLVTIGGFVQLAQHRRRQVGSADEDQLLTYAIDGVRRMERLIEDLLAYSKLDADPGAAAPVDTGAALDRALANLGAEVERAGAEVTRGPLPVVVAHEGQLVRLFQNLLGNALKFRGAAPPHVRVAAELAGDEWVFSVRDNGTGMEPQQTGRIFNMFERLPDASKVPGTGLGLAICRKIVERRGGRIWAESEPGRGSTFFFTWAAGETLDAATREERGS